VSQPGPGTEPAGSLVLGQDAFGRISAVEGIALSPAARAMFADFERQGLSAAERRLFIAVTHSPAGTVHVVPQAAEWAVLHGRGPITREVFATRQAALEAARAHGGRLVLHGTDGRILTRR